MKNTVIGLHSANRFKHFVDKNGNERICSVENNNFKQNNYHYFVITISTVAWTPSTFPFPTTGKWYHDESPN